MKKIIAFSGSNSSESINQRFVTLVAEMVDGHEVEVLDLRDFPAPIYGIDHEKEQGIPPTMLELAQRIKEADGIILSSPEHNSMMPAFLKSAIDWVSRTDRDWIRNKPVLLLSTSPGKRGGMSNLGVMASVMPHWGANVVETHSMGGFYTKVVDGKLIPEEVAVIQPKLDQFLAAL